MFIVNLCKKIRAHISSGSYILCSGEEIGEKILVFYTTISFLLSELHK